MYRKKTLSLQSTPTPFSDPITFPLMYKSSFCPQAAFENAMSKAGIRVCASQNENTSFGPVIRSLEKVSI
jgi:hypothetical protein